MILADFILNQQLLRRFQVVYTIAFFYEKDHHILLSTVMLTIIKQIKSTYPKSFG